MNLKHKITSIYVTKAITLFFIPLILIIFSGEVRNSISDYAYSDANNMFAVLITIAGTLFINNGILTNKWYNVILGLFLLGIALTPHLDYPIWHYTFTGLFFIGSIFVMVYYSSARQRIYKILAGFIIILALLGKFIFNWYTLLIAEWIGLLPICVHFIGEALNKID